MEKMDHRIEVIKLPGGEFSWRYVKVYDTLQELEEEVKKLFGKGVIEIGGKIFKLT